MYTLLTVQCFTHENWCSNKWFLANIIKSQATIKIVRVRNDFQHHSQILLSLYMNQKWSQLLQNSFYCFIWFKCLHIIEDSPQLFNSKLSSELSFQLLGLSCFNVELLFHDQNSFVWNGIPLCLYIVRMHSDCFIPCNTESHVCISPMYIIIMEVHVP